MSTTKKRGLQKTPRVRVPTRQGATEAEHPVANQVARDHNALLVPLSRVRVRPGQPRQTFSEASLTELAEDIRANGLVNPLTVTQDPDGEHFNLVAGERRLRALALLNATDAPVRVIPEENARIVQLAENLQREDLPLLEEARALGALRDEQKLSVRELAQAVNKSRGYVQRRLEILEWPQELQDLLRTHPSMLTQAAEIAKLPDPAQRQRRIAALVAPEAADTTPEPPKRPRGRPPKPFVFSERKDGGFDLRVRFRPGATDREDLIQQLRRVLQELEVGEG